MLDLSLESISFQHRNSDFQLRDVSLLARRGTHTLLAGPSGSGKSTLLKIAAGDLRPSSGIVRIGARDATSVPRKRRPILFVPAKLESPGRWSVQHLVIASLSRRSLDREDRMAEFRRLVDAWSLGAILDRRLDSLSSHELLVARLASIEALRPGLLLVERMFECAAPSQRKPVAERFFRVLRDLGTTVVAEASTLEETSFCDYVVVMDRGVVAQEGTPEEVHRRPASVAAARALGSVNVLPALVRGRTVETRAGVWDIEGAAAGEGFALIRPEDIAVAAEGEESDFIFGVEQIRFTSRGLSLLGYLPGGQVLEVAVAPSFSVRKGQLLPLRIDASRLVVVPGEHAALAGDSAPLPSRDATR